jgi:chromosome partitioning protein
MMTDQAYRIAVVAGKGGVGKTTSVINVGAALAAVGQRCLVVDCDPQSNLTSGLGLDPYTRRLTVSDVIVGRCTAAQAVVETATPGLHLLPAHPDLSAVETQLPSRIDGVLRLRDALHGVVDSTYDVVLFDTPPNFGFHTISALAAARYALVPLQMSAFALRGLKEVIRVIAVARQSLNTELELLGVVPTFVNHTRFSRDMLDALGDTTRVRVFRSEIGMTVRLQESALQGVPVFASAPSCRAAQAYTSLAAEIAEATELRPSACPGPFTLADLAADPDFAPCDGVSSGLEDVAVPEEVAVAVRHRERTVTGHRQGPEAVGCVGVLEAGQPDAAPAPEDDDLGWLTLVQQMREQTATTGRSAGPRGFRLRLFRRHRPAA